MNRLALLAAIAFVAGCSGSSSTSSSGSTSATTTAGSTGSTAAGSTGSTGTNAAGSTTGATTATSGTTSSHGSTSGSTGTTATTTAGTSGSTGTTASTAGTSGTCTDITLDTWQGFDFAAGTGNPPSFGYVGAVTPDIGTQGVLDQGQIELYTDDLGTFDLSAAPDNNYRTCNKCVRLFQDVLDDGGLGKQYFQSAGTFDVTAADTGAGLLQGTLTDVTLVEVTLPSDGGFTSTPVPGGSCVHIASSTIDVTPTSGSSGSTGTTAASSSGSTGTTTAGSSSGSTGTTTTSAGSSGSTGTTTTTTGSGSATTTGGSSGSSTTTGGSTGSGGQNFTLSYSNLQDWCSVTIAGVAVGTAPTYSASFASGTVVDLSAAPEASIFVFGYWNGTDQDTGSTPWDNHATTTVTMDSDKTIDACCPFSTAPNTPCLGTP